MTCRTVDCVLCAGWVYCDLRLRIGAIRCSLRHNPVRAIDSGDSFNCDGYRYRHCCAIVAVVMVAVASRQSARWGGPGSADSKFKVGTALWRSIRWLRQLI